MKTKTDFQAFGETTAVWVAERTGELMPASLCAETLETAEAIISANHVPVLLADLWPVSRLEMLYVPPEDTTAAPDSASSFSGQVNRAVLLAIGRIRRERNRHAAP